MMTREPLEFLIHLLGGFYCWPLALLKVLCLGFFLSPVQCASGGGGGGVFL